MPRTVIVMDGLTEEDHQRLTGWIAQWVWKWTQGGRVLRVVHGAPSRREPESAHERTERLIVP